MAIGRALEEYFVSLGFRVNQTQLNTMLNTLNTVKGQSLSFSNKINANLLKSTTAILGIIVTSTFAIGKLVESVAEADKEVELLSRQLWMTEETTRSLDMTLRAMGMSMSDLNSIALNPQLNRQFTELYNLTKNLQAPAEVQDTLELIRDVTFEFDKFKVIASYGLHHVVDALDKKLGGKLEYYKQMLSNANEWIVNHLPQIADKIATWLSWIIRLFGTLIDLVQTIYNTIKKTFDNLTTDSKMFLTAMAALWFAALNPVTLFLAGITAILLIMEDYATYKRGGKSLFGEFFGDDDMFGDMGGSIEGILGSLGSILDKITSWVDGSGALKWLLSYIERILKNIADYLQTIDDLLSGKTKLLDGLYDKSYLDPTSNFMGGPSASLNWGKEPVTTNEYSGTSFRDMFSNFSQNITIITNDPYKAGQEVVRSTDRSIANREVKNPVTTPDGI